MPSRRRLPPFLGMSFSRTGKGTNRRALRSSRSPVRNASLPKTMERGVTPSTPADRAPRLPRTRSHATTRKAGSATRLNRSSNRRSGSSVAHWCSLVWIFSTRRSASYEVGPRRVGIHRRPPDIPVPALRTRWVPSPCGRLSRPRTTTGPPPHPRAISRRRALPLPAWLAGREATRGRFPRSPQTGRRDRCPAFPLQASSTATPQAFTVAPGPT